jgi:hypothetical protein
MDRPNQLSVEQLIGQMRADFEASMRRVGEAVNRAPDGRWINGSEVEVLDIMTEFRRKTFETALQMRVDASEGDFSPGGSGDQASQAEQGSLNAVDLERQRPGDPLSPALPFPGPGHDHSR